MLVQPALVVPLAYAALFTALFSPVLLTGGLLGTTDAVIYYYPAWATHHFGWTPNLYSGYPVGGDPQAMFWYPLTWITRGLAAVLGNTFGWNAFIVGAYVLAASFAHGYARRVTGSSLGGWIAGLTYGMSGFAIAHLDHASILHTLAWAPVVFWSLEELREGPSRGWLALGAFAVGSALLAGHPQIFLYLGLLASAYVLVRAPGATGGAWRFIGRGGFAAGLGVALAAVLLVPMLELVTRSLRGAMTRDAFFQYALEWTQLPQLVLPWVMGGAAGLPGSALALPYFGPGIAGEVAGSVGLLPLVLAGVACVTWGRCSGGAAASRLVRFWTLVVLASLLLALGENAWITAPLFHVPGYDRFRIPTRHLFELALAASVLGAFGTAALERLGAVERRRAAIGACAFGVCVLGAALGAFAVAAGRGAFADEMYRAGVVGTEVMPWRNPAVVLQLLVVATGLATLLAWARRPTPALSALFVAMVALDLASFAAFAGWRSYARPASFAAPVELEPLREVLRVDGQRLTSLTFDAPVSAAPPNRNDLFDIPGVLGYGPLPLADYAALLGLSAAHFRGPDELARVLGPQDRSLDVLATRYLLVPDDTSVSDTRARAGEYFRPTREGVPRWGSVRDYLDRQERWWRRPGLPGTAVYENRRAMRGAWVVGDVIVASRDASRQAIRSGRRPDGERFDPAAFAFVEEPVPGERSCVRDCGGAEIVEVTERSVVVRAEAESDAFLVLSHVDYPGWSATLDGHPVPLYRTNTCLRGVALPVGAHEIRFDFAPTSVRVGGALSIASLVCLAAVALLPRSAHST